MTCMCTFVSRWRK